MVSKLRKILKSLLNEVYKVLMIMGVTPVEKEELESY